MIVATTECIYVHTHYTYSVQEWSFGKVSCASRALEARDLVMVRRVHMNETASQCRLLVIMIASGCPLQSRAAGQ